MCCKDSAKSCTMKNTHTHAQSFINALGNCRNFTCGKNFPLFSVRLVYGVLHLFTEPSVLLQEANFNVGKAQRGGYKVNTTPTSLSSPPPPELVDSLLHILERTAMSFSLLLYPHPCIVPSSNVLLPHYTHNTPLPL